jgi:hypothetical protein
MRFSQFRRMRAGGNEVNELLFQSKNNVGFVEDLVSNPRTFVDSE